MPSAQQREIEEPLLVTAKQEQADLSALLIAIRASSVRNLNSLHSRGSVLFAEGEQPRGIYILRTGRATVSISSSEGRVVMLGIAHAGTVLGLNSVLRNCTYDTTVKAVESCRTEFIPRAELIELMQQSHAGAQVILKLLSQELTELTDRAKLLLLPRTVSGRLAKLLLEWSKDNASHMSGTTRLDRVLTHEKIAQMIGSSRETVTRLLANLSSQQVIRITSESILICDRPALERLAC